MVSLYSYKLFILWFRDREEEFNVSDIRRETALAPQTIHKILNNLIKPKKPYIQVKGSGVKKRYLKIKDIDLNFLISEYI